MTRVVRTVVLASALAACSGTTSAASRTPVAPERRAPPAVASAAPAAPSSTERTGAVSCGLETDAVVDGLERLSPEVLALARPLLCGRAESGTTEERRVIGETRLLDLSAYWFAGEGAQCETWHRHWWISEVHPNGQDWSTKHERGCAPVGSPEVELPEALRGAVQDRIAQLKQELGPVQLSFAEPRVLYFVQYAGRRTIGDRS